MDCVFLLLDYQFHWALASDLYIYMCICIYTGIYIYTYILRMYLRIYAETCRVSELNSTSEGEEELGMRLGSRKLI
jgi:hypothetical protein